LKSAVIKWESQRARWTP